MKKIETVKGAESLGPNWEGSYKFVREVTPRTYVLAEMNENYLFDPRM